MKRATPGALNLIQIAGANALDLVERHLAGGAEKSQISLPVGSAVEITSEGEFTCLHLSGECTHTGTCPRNLCRKFSE
jgi:hypothetical protein